MTVEHYTEQEAALAHVVSYEAVLGITVRSRKGSIVDVLVSSSFDERVCFINRLFHNDGSRASWDRIEITELGWS